MRNLIISVATSAILASNSFADCSGIDSLFPMEEIIGNQVFDLNGTSADVNGKLEIANGKVNSAIKFDGSSYLSMSDSNFSNFSSDFSMVAFIKTDAKAMMQTIIDKRDGNKGYYLFLNSPATSEAILALGINGVNFGNPNTKPLNDNKWHCVAVSVDRNSNNIGTFYIDGSAVHTFDTSSITGDTSTNSNLFIGATTPNQMFSSNFEGNLDEVAFASKALSADEINCLCSRSEMLEDENDLPLIPLIEENAVTINHQFTQEDPALTAILDLSANSTTDINKNSLIPLTITTVNVKDVNLSASDSSVYFKQDGDIVYVSFSRSGEYNVTLQGFDNSGNYLSDSVTFSTKLNSAPTSSNADFNINSNEVLKFDGNTYFSDLDGDFLTYTLEGANPKGTLQINDNLIIFTPDKESYVTSFSLKATDPDGESSIATFNVNVTFASEIELLRGWNLIGNSIETKGINTSAILETDEVIYTITDSGFWEMSDLNYNSKYVKPKEGLWIKVVDDRKLTINQIPNALNDSNSKTIINGWNLLAHTKEVPLRELKFGYDQIFVYDKKNNSWLNSTTNPNYILPTFKGFWGRAIDVNETQNQAPDITQMVDNINSIYAINSTRTLNFSNFIDPDGDNALVTLEIADTSGQLTFSKISNISDGEDINITTPSSEGNYTFQVRLVDGGNAYSEWKTFDLNVSTPNIPFSRQVAFYSFNSSNTVTEINSPTYDGTTVGGVYYDSGQRGYGAIMNGTDRVVTPITSSEFPSLVKTVSLWFKFDSYASGILLFGNHNATQTGDNIIVDLTSSGILFVDIRENNSNLAYVESPSAVSKNTFHHLVVTFSGYSTSSTLELYLDSVLIGSDTLSGNCSFTDATNFTIGNNGDNAYSAGPVLIDEVRIFNDTLTYEQVQELYNLEK